jgi:hypothetical protein
VQVALALIEAEYEVAQANPDKRMFIVIQNTGIKTHRLVVSLAVAADVLWPESPLNENIAFDTAGP